MEMLYISELNPRKSVSEAHIARLADSIERFGIIHNLAGLMDEGGKVGIVAGGCRLRAIQLLAERGGEPQFATLPVKLAASAAEAEDWASAENATREEMAPADEIRAFGRMKSRGATVPEIALAFAVTEARVYQRLALAGLSELQDILEGDYTENQKAHAGCILLVSNSGKIEMTAGLVRSNDKKAAIEAGVLQAPQTAKQDTPKSPYSQKLVADMQAIQLASVQAALLAKPELVLDLLGFGLSEASGSFERIFGMRLDRPTNPPSVEDGFSVEPRLNHGIDPSEYWQQGTRVEDLSDAFSTFRETGKKARNATITEAIARTLPYQAGGTEFFASIAEEAGADIRKHWTPTAANFFSRVSAGHLTDLLCEFLDCNTRDERVAAFAKLKKAEKADKMEQLVSDPTTQKLMGPTPEQKAKLDKWVPDCT